MNKLLIVGAAAIVIAPLAVSAADPYVQTKVGLDGTTMAGISTGYRMTTKSRVEVDFAMTVLDSSTVSTRLFGAEDTDGKGGMVLSVYMPGSNQKFAFRIGNGVGNKKEYWTSVTPVAGSRHTAVFDIYHDKMHFITGATTNWSQTASDTIGPITKDCTQPLALFAYTDGANRPIASPARAKIYGCKIYESDVLIHDYEPCVKDGLNGFRDRISGGFITKGGHWDCFTVGGDYATYTSPYVSTPANNADTYVNTGYHVISNTCVALECAPISDWNGLICYAFGAAGGSDDTAAGNFNIFHAFFRHDVGFGARTLNTSGGWIQGFTPAGMLTNGIGGVVSMRRTFAIDTVVNSSGLGKTFVKTADESNGENVIHALHLTKQGYHALCLASSHAGSGDKSSIRIYGCKISESGVPVRDYVPAVVNGVAGLQDQLSGGGFVPATAGTLTAGGFVPTVTASSQQITCRQATTLTASAPNAVSYRWFRNGEEIPNETGNTLTVKWHKRSPIDTYKAIACYNLLDTTALSEPSEGVAVENLPAGLVISIR